jgi:endonuclease YncB( thermonuclease family)
MGFRPLKPEYTAWARRRRLLRWAATLMLLALGAAVLLDHLGYFGYDGDDWRRFDGRSFNVSRALDGRTLIVSADGREVTVVLLGVDPPTDPAARVHLSNRLTGRQVTLKLEPLQTRDAQGRLLAWVYLGDTGCLNLDLVRDGLARADARRASTFRGPLEAAQTDARKHRRGLWASGRTTTTTAATRGARP